MLSNTNKLVNKSVPDSPAVMLTKRLTKPLFSTETLFIVLLIGSLSSFSLEYIPLHDMSEEAELLLGLSQITGNDQDHDDNDDIRAAALYPGDIGAGVGFTPDDPIHLNQPPPQLSQASSQEFPRRLPPRVPPRVPPLETAPDAFDFVDGIPSQEFGQPRAFFQTVVAAPEPVVAPEPVAAHAQQQQRADARKGKKRKAEKNLVVDDPNDEDYVPGQRQRQRRQPPQPQAVPAAPAQFELNQPAPVIPMAPQGAPPPLVPLHGVPPPEPGSDGRPSLVAPVVSPEVIDAAVKKLNASNYIDPCSVCDCAVVRDDVRFIPLLQAEMTYANGLAATAIIPPPDGSTIVACSVQSGASEGNSTPQQARVE